MPHEEIKKARATVARLHNVEADYAAENEIRDSRDVEMWDMPEPPTRSQARPQEETPPVSQDWSGWDSWAEMHVQKGLERAADILGDEVGKVEAKLLKRIKRLETQVGELTAAAEVVERASKEAVVSLPNWRKRNDENAA
jgi:hypothetical protein